MISSSECSTRTGLPEPDPPCRTCPHGCHEADGHPRGCSPGCQFCTLDKKRPEANPIYATSRRLASDIRKSSTNVLRYDEVEKVAILAALDAHGRTDLVKDPPPPEPPTDDDDIPY